jgi:uncharacterized protein
MADLREDFVNYVVKALVADPDAVVLKRVEDEKGEYLELTVAPDDMGKVIGKAGATAKSLRTLLRGVGAKDNLSPLPIKIVDPEGSDHPKAQHSDKSNEAESPNPQNETADSTEESAPEPADEHSELHERTKREAEELADLEL